MTAPFDRETRERLDQFAHGGSTTLRADVAAALAEIDRLRHAYAVIEQHGPDLRASLAEIDRRGARIAIQAARIAELEAERDQARLCLGFFASVIKSGEPWTAACESSYRAALAPAPAAEGDGNG